jgi:anti-anti-sigma factor
MALEIESAGRGDGPRIVVRGPLDITTGDALERALLEAERGAPAVLELDLRGVGFFDSTGLQIVLDAHVRAGEEGRRLVVIAADSEARRVLDLAEVSGDLELR